jgi:signal transduction histidine kinase
MTDRGGTTTVGVLETDLEPSATPAARRRHGWGRLGAGARRLFRKVDDLFDEYASYPPLAGHRRRAVVVGTLVAVLVVSVVDVVTVRSIDLDAVYVLPVILATARVSTRFGLVVALESGVLWLIVTSIETPVSIATSGANLLLRVAVLVVIVRIVSALQAALAATRLSERRAKDFLADAAHQLRTPLAGLRSCADSLVLSGVSPQQRGLLAHIGTESQRMGRTVASMLRLARLDRGEVFAGRPVELTEICMAAINAARGPLPGPVDVHLHGTGTLLVVSVSPEAVAEALGNLLDNALRHAVSRVDVYLHTSGEVVSIAVADDGAGLPSDAEQVAFERFVTLDGRGGSGLGLAVGRGLVESQRGTLTYEAGRFVIRLPVHG